MKRIFASIVISTVALLAFSACANKVDTPNSESVSSSSESDLKSQNGDSQDVPESETAPLETIGNYDMLQTVYCMINKDMSHTDVIDLLDKTGLYYDDQSYGLDRWTIEVSFSEPIDSTYGANIYGADHIEISIDNNLVDLTEYFFHEKNVKALYSQDIGYTGEDEENATEEFVFVDLNDKQSYAYANEKVSSREEALDLGISYAVDTVEEE